MTRFYVYRLQPSVSPLTVVYAGPYDSASWAHDIRNNAALRFPEDTFTVRIVLDDQAEVS